MPNLPLKIEPPSEYLPKVKVVMANGKTKVWLNGQEIKTATSLKIETDAEDATCVTLAFDADVETITDSNELKGTSDAP